MPLTLDAHGQPPEPLNALQNARKAVNELYGLCQGILVDRKLTAEEIVFLGDWFSRSTHILSEWPACAIAPKLAEILIDGEITAEEIGELQVVLQQAIGDPPAGSTNRYSTRLDCEDVRAVHFEQRSFCFTGKFEYADRKTCQRLTVERGGQIRKDVTLDLDYLVIGTLASRDWAHASHGRKIEAALRNKQSGAVTEIVSEKNWRSCLEEAT